MNFQPPLSPLQLKDHRFTNLRVKFIEGGSATAEPSLKQEIGFVAVPNTTDEWQLVLTLQLGSSDASKPFLYDVEIQVHGIVQVSEGFPADRKEQLALVNGFSMLYSAAREMLLNVTARSGGAVSLPTLSFVALVQDALKQKSEAQAQPPPPAVTA